MIEKLYLMDTGYVKLPLATFEPGNKNAIFPQHWGIGTNKKYWVWFAIHSYLVVHSHGLIVIDPGMHSGVRDNPIKFLGFGFASLFPTKVDLNQDAISQIRVAGYDPQNIKYLILSHLHVGDVSGLEHFVHLKDLKVVVDRNEWQAAHNRWGMLQGYKSDIIDLPFNYQMINYENAYPYGPFPHSIDLLGDGSIILVSTPGHSSGHQSIILRIGKRTILLPVGACRFDCQKNQPVPMSFLSDSSEAEKSVERIKDYINGNSNLFVIYDHDPILWKSYKKVPEYYGLNS